VNSSNSHGSSGRREKAIDDLKEAVKSAENAAFKVLLTLKGRGGDVPVHTGDKNCLKDNEYKFYCTYKNMANLHTLLEHMDDVVKKFD